VFGMIYAMILSKIFLDGLAGGNWRAMLALGAFPSLLVFLGTAKYIKESPRFMIAQGKVEQGVSILNYIGTKNKRAEFEPITSDERIDLINWQQKLFYAGGVDKVTWKSLFSEENRRVTWCLIVNWFGLSFNFFGMVFILPIVINHVEPSGHGVNEFFLTMLGEIPAILIAYFLIDRKSFGRKNTTLYSHILAALAFGLAYFSGINLLIILMIVARIFTKMGFISINPLTSELYPTSFRTIAVGLTSGIGRLGATIMPVVTMKVFNANAYGPFLVFGVIGIGMAIAAALIPFEPLGRQLDNIAKSPEEELKEKDTSFEMYA